MRQMVEFLNRDVRSFLPSVLAQVDKPIAESSGTVDPVLTDSLVDSRKLDCLAFRREVLDWRDNFHAQVTLTASALHEEFIQLIDAELNEVAFFRQLIARRASEVLQGPFVREVRVPLYSSLRQEEKKRATLDDKSTSHWQFNFTFKMQWSDSECDCLGDIGFKPTNREVIVSRIETLILGDEGIAATYREQATRLARQLIEEKQPC